MQPTGQREFRTDPLLTSALIGYRPQRFIADLIFPRTGTQTQAGIVPGVKQSAFFRDQAHERGPGTKSRGGGFDTDLSLPFFCRRYSWRDEITDDDRRNSAGTPFDLDLLKGRKVYGVLGLQREVKFATDYFKAGVWGGELTGGPAADFPQWNDYGASAPLVDVSASQDNIESRIGVEGNTLVLGKQVWLKLKWHPDLVDSIKYTERGVITEDLAASLMGLQRLLVGRAITTTSPVGTPESNVVYSRVWGKHALVLYVTDTPQIGEPTAGLTITWEAVAPGVLDYIKRMRDEEREVDIIEGNTYYEQKLTLARAGEIRLQAVA